MRKHAITGGTATKTSSDATATGATLVTVTHDHDLLPRFDRSIDVVDLIDQLEEPQITQIDADKELER